MPTTTLIGELASIAALPVTAPPGVSFRPLAGADRTSLAQLYLESYPPGAAAADLVEALSEVDATLAGDYGELWTAASLVAVSDQGVVGSIQVVRRSPWDPELSGPFVIELFVGPTARHRGVGSALLRLSARVCRAAGQSSIALRTAGPDASPHALRLNRNAGMRPL